MLNYDFTNLSTFEFENLIRDLLQNKFNLFIESFTTGRDSGIDLRFAIDTKSSTIIQVKRYTKYSDLKSSLKKDIYKIKKLKPKSYIIATSVGLTPKNKSELMNMFKPYIKSTMDILGNNDINNLLGQFPSIEKQYYKLWLSSISILEKILHSKVFNQSTFEIDEIKETLKTYVINDSFNNALDILKKYHYVIISGLPGIGKTTLARMLVYQILAKEYDEFIYISDTINDAFEFYKEDCKQIFYFDDFLGKNFLDVKPRINEDNNVIKFIHKISKSTNKLFILTTREYILQQAKNSSESYNNPSIDFAKCVLDLSIYTKIIKAQILYNHIYYSEIPEAHLSYFINSKKYRNLITHKNYNPRIIETFIQNRSWDKETPSTFTDALEDFFNNPQSVWLHAYQNTISKQAQVVLLVLSTLKTPVLIEDLINAINAFIIENKVKYSGIDSTLFYKLLKELGNTFLTINTDSVGKTAIEFQNPSIYDFMINFIRDKTDLQTDLIKSFSYYEQFYSIFTFHNESKNKKFTKIVLKDNPKKILIHRLISNYNTFKTSSIFRLHFTNNNNFRWETRRNSTYTLIENIYDEFGSNKKINDLLIIKLFEDKTPSFNNSIEKSSYTSLILKMTFDKSKYNIIDILNNIYSQLETFDEINEFYDFKNKFSHEFTTLSLKNNYIDNIKNIINSEIDSIDKNDYFGFYETLESFNRKHKIEIYNEISRIEEKSNEYNDYLESYTDDALEEYKINENEDKEIDEDEYIDNIFDSLV